jgi:hypothetical protein
MNKDVLYSGRKLKRALDKSEGEEQGKRKEGNLDKERKYMRKIEVAICPIHPWVCYIYLSRSVTLESAVECDGVILPFPLRLTHQRLT